jgi:hypothetical protein
MNREFRNQLKYYDRTSNLWGNLARDVATYYKINDYILIEGYLSLRDARFEFNSSTV